MKFYPYKKGAEKGLAMLKGGGATLRFEIVLTRALEVLAMLKVGGGGRTEFAPFERSGGMKSYSLS